RMAGAILARRANALASIFGAKAVATWLANSWAPGLTSGGVAEATCGAATARRDTAVNRKEKFIFPPTDFWASALPVPCGRNPHPLLAARARRATDKTFGSAGL